MSVVQMYQKVPSKPTLAGLISVGLEKQVRNTKKQEGDLWYFAALPSINSPEATARTWSNSHRQNKDRQFAESSQCDLFSVVVTQLDVFTLLSTALDYEGSSRLSMPVLSNYRLGQHLGQALPLTLGPMFYFQRTSFFLLLVWEVGNRNTCVYFDCVFVFREEGFFSLLVLSWVFISSGVEFQRNFSIQSNSKIVVYDTPFFEPSEISHREKENRKEVLISLSWRLHLYDWKSLREDLLHVEHKP